MKILVFLHGTTIMHKGGVGHKREDIVKQVVEGEESVIDFISYVPIGSAVGKLKGWKMKRVEIIYLSSHENLNDVQKDKLVLEKYNFPKGQIVYRQRGESYKDIAERIIPDVLIEDDCESIGGKKEMTITFVTPRIKRQIQSIVVKEFEGIDHLTDNPYKLTSLDD